MWHRGGVPMALGRKRRWLVVSGVLAVTGLMMLSLWAAIPQEVRSRIAAAVQVHTRAGNLERKPLRYIKDPNPAWSSIAVNAENNMVVMTDENLFRVWSIRGWTTHLPKRDSPSRKGLSAATRPAWRCCAGR